MNYLNTSKKIYFVGIGGIGMSAIARFCLSKGKKVFGSDLTDSETVSKLKEEGATITIGQKIQNLPENIDLVVYSAAIPVAEPDFFAKIKNLGVSSISYAEALGEISKDKFTVAVSGTHGKTTTTAMLAHILIKAGLNPTVIVGSYMVDPRTGKKTNFISGGDCLVVEADDYHENFLALSPRILIITNIGEDHLDYYKDIEGVITGFAKLVAKLPEDGVIIANFGDKNTALVVEKGGRYAIDYRSMEVLIKLKMPGEHNLLNAKAALTASALLGVKSGESADYLGDFDGLWRRFEFRGETAKGALVYDDYAHNPEKVKAVLSGARQLFPGRKIIAVFEPHLFSRTKTLFKQFSESFAEADEIVVLPIYPAREVFDPTISSKMLSDAIAEKESGKRISYFELPSQAVDHLKNNFGKNDVILLIGAGDVYKMASLLVVEQ